MAMEIKASQETKALNKDPNSKQLSEGKTEAKPETSNKPQGGNCGFLGPDATQAEKWTCGMPERVQSNTFGPSENVTTSAPKVTGYAIRVQEYNHTNAIAE